MKALAIKICQNIVYIPQIKVQQNQNTIDLSKYKSKLFQLHLIWSKFNIFLKCLSDVSSDGNRRR